MEALKANDIRLIPYVPDNVLRPLIEAMHADPFFTAFSARARRRRSASSPAPGWAGMRGIVLMQTCGFATLANVHGRAALRRTRSRC